MKGHEEFYQACNLKGNPFRSNATLNSDPRINIWVGYEKERDHLLKFLSRTRADQVGNTNFIMLYGDYGTGKSHALLFSQNYILNLKAQEFDSVCYVIPSLKKAKGQLSFASAFAEDIVAKSGLLKDLIIYKNFLSTQIVRYRDEKQLPHSTSEDDIIENIIPSVDLYNFAKSLRDCETQEEFGDLICPKGLTDYQAITTFTRIVNLFVLEMKLNSGIYRFKKAAYLFIDELDDLLRTTVKETRIVNDSLRHLYDACPNCFGLVIALTAEVAQFTTIFEDYILSRIQKRVELRTLEKNDAIRFVTEILDSVRLDPNGPSGAFPFEDSAIEGIVSQLVERTPRKVVDKMQQIIEEIRLADLDPSDHPVTFQELEDKDILAEVLGE
jgi:hypothetical protein